MAVSVTPGPWQGGVGTMSDYAPAPTRQRTTSSTYYLSGGNTTRSFLSGTTGTVTEGEHQEARQDAGYFIEYYSSGDLYSWNFGVCTGGAAWPGLGYYEPLTEMRADPQAIGWQLPGSPISLNRAACLANGAGDLYDEWTTWDDATETSGYWTYWLWLNTHYVPMSSGHLRVKVVTPGAQNPYTGSDTLIVGAPANSSVTAMPNYDLIFMSDVYTTGVVGGTSYPIAGNEGKTFNGPLPPMTSVPGYGDCVIPGIATTNIRGAMELPSPNPGEYATRGTGVSLEVDVYATSPKNQWRLLYAVGRPSAVRRFPRGDGLVLGPRRHFTTSGSTQQGGSRIGWR